MTDWVTRPQRLLPGCSPAAVGPYLVHFDTIALMDPQRIYSTDQYWVSSSWINAHTFTYFSTPPSVRLIIAKTSAAGWANGCGSPPLVEAIKSKRKGDGGRDSLGEKGASFDAVWIWRPDDLSLEKISLDSGFWRAKG